MDLWNQFLREIRKTAPAPLNIDWLMTLDLFDQERVIQWQNAYLAGWLEKNKELEGKDQD